MKTIILLCVLLLLLSCNKEDEIFIYHEFHGEYISLDDTLPKISPAIYTSKFVFYDNNSFNILDDDYALTYLNGEYKYQYRYTQTSPSSIIKAEKTNIGEVLTFKIQRVNIYNEPILTGYKTYRIYKSNNLYVLVLVAEEQHYDNYGNTIYKWVDVKINGDTTYLKKI